MRLKVYTIRDVVAGNCSELKMFNNEEQAKRWFRGVCEESKISKDLQLYYCCDYDLTDNRILVKDACEQTVAYYFEFVEGGC